MFSNRLSVSARPPLLHDRAPACFRVPARFEVWAGLAGFFKRSVERLVQRPAARTLLIEERLLLGGKKSVLLLSCGGRRYLVGSSGDALTPLVEVLPFDNPQSIASQTMASPPVPAALTTGATVPAGSALQAISPVATASALSSKERLP